MGLDMYLYKGRNCSTELAYWRKANAIHNYFVNEVGNGVDNCKPIRVTCADLEELLSRCERVLKALSESKYTVGSEECLIVNEKTGKFELGTVEYRCYDCKLAKELLPPIEGFFFGSYDINSYYEECLIYTRDICKQLISETNWDKEKIYYQASW